jgi:parvulin-like peptidyl-prolyl isomerase
MEMKTRLLFVPLLLALVASLAACGGGSQVPANAIAVVKGTPITVAQFNDFFTQAVNQAKATSGVAPQPGTPQYTALRSQVVSQLVQIAEVKQVAAKEGVSVSQSDIDKFVANIVKTNYNGSEKKFEDAVKKAGLTVAQAQRQVFIHLLVTKLQAKVTKTAKVSEAQEKAYYTTNLAQYAVPAGSTTRQLAHILVKTKAEALKIEKQLQNGANFAALAKKYSTDPGSAANGGQICIAKSGSAGPCQQTVPPFAKAGFALKTGAISPPVHSQFGWHVIKALGPVMKKAYTEPFSQVQAAIQHILLGQQQQQLWQQWITDFQNEYKGKVNYQSSYAPPATTALPTTNGVTVPTPTTTG